jgi:hypothetical protein
MGAAKEFAASFFGRPSPSPPKLTRSATSTDLYFAMSPCKQVGCVSAGAALQAVRKNTGQRDLYPRFA